MGGIRSPMELVRHRLASCALALTAVQLALLFMAPVSACCKTAAAAASHAQIAASEDAPDCCPPGAHRDGECPLHRGGKREARGVATPTHCRFTCDHTSGAQLIVGAIGVIPAPSAAAVPLAESSLPPVRSFIVPLRPAIPDAPPPELL
jgi:hypothetical protein